MVASLAGHAVLLGVALAVWPRAPADDAAGPLTVRLVVAAAPGDAGAMIGLPEPPPPPDFTPMEPTAALPLPPPLPAPVPARPPRRAAEAVKRPMAVAMAAPVEQAGVAAAAPGGPAAGAADVADWRQRVAAWIGAHQRYPAAARRMGVEGVATLRFLLGEDGRVSGLVVAAGSGSAMLDRAALAVFDGAILPPPPPGTPEAARWITVPMRYRLAGG